MSVEDVLAHVTWTRPWLGRFTLRRLHAKMWPRLTGLPYLTERATRLGGLPHLSCKHDQIKMRDYMKRQVTPPRRVNLPSGLPHLPGFPHLGVNRPWDKEGVNDDFRHPWGITILSVVLHVGCMYNVCQAHTAKNQDAPAISPLTGTNAKFLNLHWCLLYYCWFRLFKGVPKAMRGEIWMFLAKQQDLHSPAQEEHMAMWREKSFNEIKEGSTCHQHSIFIDLGEEEEQCWCRILKLFTSHQV